MRGIDMTWMDDFQRVIWPTTAAIAGLAIYFCLGNSIALILVGVGIVGTALAIARIILERNMEKPHAS